MILVRTLDGYNCPLAYIERGLILKNILDIFWDNKKFVVLTYVVHSLSTMGWALFPGIYTAYNTFSNLHSDILALLGYDVDKYDRVMKKVKVFIGRIAH